MEGNNSDIRTNSIGEVVETETIDQACSITSKAKCNCSKNTPRTESDSDGSETEQDPTSLESNQCPCCGGEVLEEKVDNTLPDEVCDTHVKKSPRPCLNTKIRLPKDQKKPKLRTSKDVFDRLKWDSTSIIVKNKEGQEEEVDQSSVYVGYKDRFLGMCEVQLNEFQPGGDIPFHRIYYFRTGGPPVDPFVGKDGEVKVGDHNLPTD